MTVKMTYDIARASAKDAADRQAKANHRQAWSEEDYNLACRVLAQLYPECGANPRAGLAKWQGKDIFSIGKA